MSSKSAKRQRGANDESDSSKRAKLERATNSSSRAKVAVEIEANNRKIAEMLRKISLLVAKNDALTNSMV